MSSSSSSNQQQQRQGQPIPEANTSNYPYTASPQGSAVSLSLSPPRQRGHFLPPHNSSAAGSSPVMTSSSINPPRSPGRNATYDGSTSSPGGSPRPEYRRRGQSPPGHGYGGGVFGQAGSSAGAGGGAPWNASSESLGSGRGGKPSQISTSGHLHPSSSSSNHSHHSGGSPSSASHQLPPVPGQQYPSSPSSSSHYSNNNQPPQSSSSKSSNPNPLPSPRSSTYLSSSRPPHSHDRDRQFLQLNNQTSSLPYDDSSLPYDRPSDPQPPSVPAAPTSSSSHHQQQQHHHQQQQQLVAAPPPHPKTAAGQLCAKCELPMTGQFVRALGTVYHLDCFRCQDCNKVVASKFFPVDSPDPNGKQYPLCETDYFRRLNLLCTKCGAALRGSYITALDMKFHVEHFTCSVCPTVFGPQDSYYEHDGSVYCHFHYSTRFAVKCTGCRTAILKQFVEINRNSTNEHWHPECYMIHKFWNIKLAPSAPITSSDDPDSSSTVVTPSATSPTISSEATAKPVESAKDATGPPSKALDEEEYLAQERTETPVSLKDRQKRMEDQVYKIWTVLSAFEESSAACISEMLRHVSSGHYVDGVRMAEKFVLHVETLFSAIDDLSEQFRLAGAKDIAHVREARMLCKKVVNFFSLLSHTHEAGARKMSITQELLSLVTGLAHYLKILIRIALTAALKLERDYENRTAIEEFLDRLDQLARDPEATKLAPVGNGVGNGVDPSRTPRQYGYKSLTRAVGTLVGQGEATSDLCEVCKLTVEEECARFGTSLRWHLACLRCSTCGREATKDRDPFDKKTSPTPWIYARDFRIEPQQGPSGADQRTLVKGGRTTCAECAGGTAGLIDGFDYVTRLEQYAFLLCVALNKLYALLKQRGAVPSSPDAEESTVESGERSLYDAYRDSTDIKRMKSVNLDRKLSSTTARVPKRSTVIQSPTGRVAHPNDLHKPPVPSRKDQPILDPSRAATVPRPSPPTQPQSYRSLPFDAASPPPSNGSSRPQYNRATTQVRIVDDQVPAPLDGPVLGGPSEPTQDENGITLADLPQVMQAEQAREQHRYVPSRMGTLLSELSALEYFIVKHVAALMLSENAAFRDVAPLDELLDIIDTRKNTFWGKLFKGGNEKKTVKKKGVFGIPLEVLVERNGADSMHGAGAGSLRIPSFVDDVISAMKQMDMSIEGIFRKNGNIRRLKDLSEELDRDQGSVNLSDDNPVQLAALLKKFLRDLPDPLMTFKLFQLFLATQRVEPLEERKTVMHLVCCLLPKSHRDTMEVIFVFLKWVASFSHVDEETGSKMDLQNLATVICPNILYSKSKDPYKDESFSAVRCVHELLEFQDEFWQVPPEFVAILNDQDLFNNPQLSSKEIISRAENFVRSNKSRRMDDPMSRGEVHPHRPDLRQGWSAPNVAGRSGGPPPNPLRANNERPISFSTYAPYQQMQQQPTQWPPASGPPRPNLNPQPHSFQSPHQHPYASPQASPDFRRPPHDHPPQRNGSGDQSRQVAVNLR